MGPPQLELSRQLSINDRSNNRNSWTASVTQINRIGFIVELAGWFDIERKIELYGIYRYM